jgi:hypothetical protein
MRIRSLCIERGAGLRRSFTVALAVACASATTATIAHSAAAAPGNTIPGSGTYLVGKDFQAGVYRSTGNDSCYWERARNAGGAFSSIIANDIGSGQRLVYVRSADKVFTTSRCHTWTRVFSSVAKSKSKRTTIPGNGSYLVGSDFVPGTYRSRGNTDYCYWERARSADGTSGSIIANGISTGQLVVTIGARDSVFGSSRCAAWKRIG